MRRSPAACLRNLSPGPTLQVGADSVIVPNSSASQSEIESTLAGGIRDALLYFSVDGTFSIPVQIKLTSFPNTALEILQQGAVTIERDNQSFVILGFNVSPQQTVEVSALVSANTPVSPFDTHFELAEACGNDILNAFIQSGDLGGFVSRFVARHTDNLGPRKSTAPAAALPSRTETSPSPLTSSLMTPVVAST